MNNPTTSLAADLPSSGNHWKYSLTALALIQIWIGYCYWDTLVAMAKIWWRSDTYAHGLIVPPISIWLIWRDREQLTPLQPEPTFWFIPALIVVIFCWLLGELTSVNSLTQFSVIGICILATMSVLGLQVSKRLAFPLLFLFFAVPIGDFLLPRLMEWTADFTVIALRATGIPVYREGQNFVIPSGRWSVVEACSGIRYLIASLTIGVLYAYLTYTSLKRRLIFALLSLFVPILANWLRAYLIVLLGHISNNELAAGVDHLIYGWIFFGIVIAIMFVIGMRWAEPTSEQQSCAVAATTFSQRPTNFWLLPAMIAIFVAAGPLADDKLRQGNASTPVRLSPPVPKEAWHPVTPPIAWQPVFNNASAEFQSAYNNADRWVGLYIAFYRNQNYERKLVTSTNALATSLDPVWQVVTGGQATANIAGNQLRVRQSELLEKQGNPEERYVIWQWYWINGRLTSSEIEAKWLTALAMLSGKGDDSAVVVVYTPKKDAEAILTEFTHDLGEQIQFALADTQRK
jgi:exosortase A